jgi:hypothetical protein
VLRATQFPFSEEVGPKQAGNLMDVHVSSWATPKAYFRRGHIAALIAALVFRVQLTLARRRERRNTQRLRVALEDLPDHIKRDIGLI